MFEEIRNEVKEVIKNSNNNEINNNSNNKNIGIYMIYIDNFNDDKIIPIYIGQTGYGKNRNFQIRYKEHLQEVMALNRLRYDYYKYVLLSNFYDGHYKACKIFQYMVDHDCTLKDFHMIVLEELDINNNNNIQELLDKKEQEYFSKYLPAFFGFNQTNAVTEGAKEAFSSIKEDGKYVKSDKLLKYELEDCENFLKYFGYGYTKFNYYHCFPKTHIIEENDKKISYELKEKKDLLKSKYYDENKFKIYNDKLLKLEEKRKKLVNKIEDYKKQFEDVYAPRIKEYCKENKIGLAQKYKEIINMLIYQNKNSISDFEKYLKRKKINVNILNILNKDTKFTNWRKQYIEYTENNDKLKCEINECRNIRRTDDLIPEPKIELEKEPIYAGKKALIGDYFKDSYTNTKRVLESLGFDVTVALSGTEVVKRVKDGENYDIIFSNNIYRNGTGQECLKELKQIEGFNTPVVIHTLTENKRDYFVNEIRF